MDAYDLLVAHTQTPAPAANGRITVEDEAVRIRDLPRTDYTVDGVVEAAMQWATERWGRPGAPMQFREIQALALYVVHLMAAFPCPVPVGAFLPIGTGHGKELISRLAADAAGARRPLLLIPPDMRRPFHEHTPEYSRSFRLPQNLRVMAYSQLSQARASDILEELQPDVLVADEAHLLRNDSAARTKRVERYIKKHPNVLYVPMSGTLTKGSIKDYAHLALWALKHRSFCPKDYKTKESFSAVLDAKPTRAGGNGRFVSEPRTVDWNIFSPLFPDWESFESTGLVEDPEAPEDFVSPRTAEARERWRDRMRHSPGVVATRSASCDAALYLVSRPLQTPQVVLDELARLEETWQRPDGEELVDSIAKWRCGRQLSQGFYYRWKWPTPDCKPTEDDLAWMRARAAWHKEIRRVVAYGRVHLDSPMLVGREARRGLDGEGALQDDRELLGALREWKNHEHRRWSGKDVPPTETIWLSDFMVNDALAWMKKHPTGLVFYSEHAMSDALAAHGVAVYGGGTNPEDLQGRSGAALSLHSHKQGKNLQKHSEALLLSFDPHAGNMEQLLSRTHRAGQAADEVRWWYYAHTEPAKQAVLDARTKALYVQTTMGDPQRLCTANWVREEDSS